jgi:hypothetical protein
LLMSISILAGPLSPPARSAQAVLDKYCCVGRY